jgi:bifunctional non-homologous end joining protein LigD
MPTRDTSINTYRAKRDFAVTSEPAPGAAGEDTRIFVVQKHDASRLHYDFRLEHGGVLWSWAVPKGPSLDSHDKRLAVRVEDHPRDYAQFEGTIPAGNYGAGTVEIWDHGTWAPVGDAAKDLARGELKFILAGARLRGHFVLVRLKPKPREKGENWLLIKEHDEEERAGADAAALEAVKLPAKKRAPRGAKADPVAAKAAPAKGAPAKGAVRAKLPASQAPQLATLAQKAPDGADWMTEVKFDGYRLLAWVRNGTVSLFTRNGQDWTARLPQLAEAVAKLKLSDGLIDGELVALQSDGVSSFSRLQAALSDGRDGALHYYVFDLLYLNGWDLRACRLADRKQVLRGLSSWRGALRYSDHIEADGLRAHSSACGMGLEGIICKQADSPYKAGRGGAWLKVKCTGREEFVILGWTDPAGSRRGFGALHLGFYDGQGALHYAGGVGTGFDARTLRAVRTRLDELAGKPPGKLLFAGDPPEHGIHWVRPELVAEVKYIGWSGAGRLRHASYLGLREDKPAAQVVRAVPDPAEQRRDAFAAPARRIVVAKKPDQGSRDAFEGVRLTHPEKELWPGITKHDLAAYWRDIADHALPAIAHRPLALVRCPDGIEGQHFFQKHPGVGTAPQLRGGEADGAPYLAIDGIEGLYGATQMGAIELHSWGSSLADPLHPDRLVFDLDPGEGVGMAAIVAAAQDVRERLASVGLASWCRTSGGAGLHVVAPLKPQAGWDEARAWCRGFAEAMVRDAPDLYVAQVSKQKRRGHILIDWLRNGLGSTAIASFSPRARPGAGVATPLAWKDVNAKLDVSKYTLHTVPGRLRALKFDPWKGFDASTQVLPAQRGGRGKR